MSSLGSFDLHDKFSRMDLVSWTFGNEDYDQNREIYIDPDNPGRSITASEARSLVRKLVAGFKAVGLQRGDCVCLHAFNDIMYTMLFLGIVGAGGRFTGSNPAYTPTELSHHIQNTKTRFIITESELLPKIAPAAEVSGVSASNIYLFDAPKQNAPFRCNAVQELLRHGEADWVTFTNEDEAKNTTAALLSTSGTTGLPKAAMISHYSCVVENLILEDSSRKPYHVSRLISLPEFHAFAFPVAHIAPLREGIPTYIMRRFEIQRYLGFINQYQITETPMVPAIMSTILKASPPASGMLQSLRLVWSAGAPLDQRTQDQMYRLLVPSARVIQVWGMTEAGWITTFTWPEKDHTGSVGRLLLGVEAKLVGEDGNIIEKDSEKGEISIRGPLVMQGYLGNEEATYNALDLDGWLKTGDVGYKEQGKFFIVDRKKEMIKVRGWQVSPAELESVLLIHTGILEAAVIGSVLPNSNAEAPRAYIVKSPESNLNEGDIKTHMAEYLAKYKNLDGGIVFTNRIPRTSTGKIDRKQLRERAKREIKDAQAKTLILAVFSSLRRTRKPTINVLKPTTTSQFDADGSSQNLPFTPISTNSEYSRSDELKRDNIDSGKNHRYTKRLRFLWRVPRSPQLGPPRQHASIWGRLGRRGRAP